MAKRLTNQQDIDNFLTNDVDETIAFGLEIHPFGHCCWDKNRRGDGESYDAENYYIEKIFKKSINAGTPVKVYFTEYNHDTGTHLFEHQKDRDDQIWLKLDHIKAVTILDNKEEDEHKKTGRGFIMNRMSRGFSNMKQLAFDGAKLAIGKKAALILQDHIIKSLKNLKVPDVILENKIVKTSILVATPNLLRMGLEFFPNIKISEKISTILDAACIASSAQASEEMMESVTKFVKPILKELTAINIKALETTDENKQIISKKK